MIPVGALWWETGSGILLWPHSTSSSCQAFSFLVHWLILWLSQPLKMQSRTQHLKKIRRIYKRKVFWEKNVTAGNRISCWFCKTCNCCEDSDLHRLSWMKSGQAVLWPCRRWQNTHYSQPQHPGQGFRYAGAFSAGQSEMEHPHFKELDRFVSERKREPRRSTGEDWHAPPPIPSCLLK